MLLLTSVVKKYLLSPRYYHHQAGKRYDGYWTLLLQQPSSVTMPATITTTTTPACLDTTNSEPDALASDATPIGDDPEETITTDQDYATPSPSFVWLQNEKIPLPAKPPPPENCCMR
jgi:hypothetical protein